MKKIINNKGFTLVELLAVLVILSAIMGIAIPSITSSMERSKEKQNEQKKEMLESFAELYVTDHKNAIYKNLVSSDSCFIEISTLKTKGYLSDEADVDVDGKSFTGYIKFDKSNNSYQYIDDISGLSQCAN